MCSVGMAAPTRGRYRRSSLGMGPRTQTVCLFHLKRFPLCIAVGQRYFQGSTFQRGTVRTARIARLISGSLSSLQAAGWGLHWEALRRLH